MAKLALASASSSASRREYQECYNVSSVFLSTFPGAGASERARRVASGRRRLAERLVSGAVQGPGTARLRAPQLVRRPVFPRHCRDSPRERRDVRRSSSQPPAAAARRAQSLRSGGGVRQHAGGGRGARRESDRRLAPSRQSREATWREVDRTQRPLDHPDRSGRALPCASREGFRPDRRGDGRFDQAGAHAVAALVLAGPLRHATPATAAGTRGAAAGFLDPSAFDARAPRHQARRSGCGDLLSARRRAAAAWPRRNRARHATGDAGRQRDAGQPAGASARRHRAAVRPAVDSRIVRRRMARLA